MTVASKAVWWEYEKAAEKAAEKAEKLASSLAAETDRRRAAQLENNWVQVRAVLKGEL